MRAMQENVGGDRNTKVCQVRLDRIQILAETKKARLPAISGFRIMWDTFVRRQTTVSTYRRVRECKNPGTGTRLFIQYQPTCPWLSPLKATLVGNDRQGLRRRELETIFSCFTKARLLLVEVAVDFLQVSGVDCRFIRRHAVFGKSRPRASSYPDSLRYGSRKSDTLIRCYSKPSVSAFRVEIELHSSWLRRKNVLKLKDLRRLPDLLYSSHIRFVQFDWVALARHLRHKGLPANKILQAARTEARSIHGLMGFLRHELGLRNVHRFLIPLEMNEQIRLALENWSRRW